MRKGSIKLLLATRGKDNAWARAALNVLHNEGANDAHSRVELSKERVLAVYSVRKDIASSAFPETSWCIGEMLNKVESTDIENVVIHTVVAPASDQDIWIFTDIESEVIFGVVPVSRRTS